VFEDMFTHTARPPDPARAGRWREAFSAEAIARFEAIAGDVLDELGYGRDTRPAGPKED
jgi:hypothetical protein